MITYKYTALLGVGGIGSGVFFRVNGNHTIGREESRSGRYLDQRDYCKLHIISHYVKVLLGENFEVFPIGKVGNDPAGITLMDELRSTGFNMKYMDIAKDSHTLYSFCFIYPDGSGGNLTTADSACSEVNAAFVGRSEPEFRRLNKKGIALLAPEVPLKAREKLLEMGSLHGFFNAASFTTEEMPYVIRSGMLAGIDLLALNLEEASAAAGLSIVDNDPGDIIQKSVDVFTSFKPEILISITQGKEGSWTWDGYELNHLPAHKVEVKNTAGAGDAHFAGLLTGLTAGFKLAQAQQFASLVSSYSVSSQHTIHPELNKESLVEMARRSEAEINNDIIKFLEDK